MSDWLLFGLSLLGCFAALFHWQVWIAAIMNVVVNFCALLLYGLLGSQKALQGCFAVIIGACIQCVVGAFLMAATIGMLLPIMMGGNETTPFSSFLQIMPYLFKAAISATIWVFCLSVIPILGQLIMAGGPGLTAFLEGAIIFKAVAEMVLISHVSNTASFKSPVVESFFPSGIIWFGYCIIAGILTWLILMAITFLEYVFWKKRRCGYAI
jgi:hypothetical protein